MSDSKGTIKGQSQSKSFGQIAKEQFQSLAIALILAIIIRGFLVEPFRIPSESMIPTLVVGDFLFVSRYEYGLRVPFTKKWLVEFDDPQRGDVIVFNYPKDESVDFIKRVVGVPGDRVAMRSGVLYVNDEPIRTEAFSLLSVDPDDSCNMVLEKSAGELLPAEFKPFPSYLLRDEFQQRMEWFGDKMHMIQYAKGGDTVGDFSVVVPERSFFAMGDNRDMSGDSRFWGFVPRENIKGKAQFIWLSLNNDHSHCRYNFIDPQILPNIRWSRFGRAIK